MIPANWIFTFPVHDEGRLVRPADLPHDWVPRAPLEGEGHLHRRNKLCKYSFVESRHRGGVGARQFVEVDALPQWGHEQSHCLRVLMREPLPWPHPPLRLLLALSWPRLHRPLLLSESAEADAVNLLVQLSACPGAPLVASPSASFPTILC